jgi:hypothetical protein
VSLTRRPEKSKSLAQEFHCGHSTQVPDGPSSRRDISHPGGHRRDVACGRGAEASLLGGAPELCTGAALWVLRAASGTAGHRGVPHGRARARVPDRDRLRRRAAALDAGLPTAELSSDNPGEGGFPGAVRQHCVLSGAESRRRRGQVARRACRPGSRGDGRSSPR